MKAAASCGAISGRSRESNSFPREGLQVFFFSKEESRKHVHVYCGDGEAKFWLEPAIELADNYGLKRKQLSKIQRIIEERKDEIIDAWKKHLGS